MTYQMILLIDKCHNYLKTFVKIEDLYYY